VLSLCFVLLSSFFLSAEAVGKIALFNAHLLFFFGREGWVSSSSASSFPSSPGYLQSLIGNDRAGLLFSGRVFIFSVGLCKGSGLDVASGSGFLFFFSIDDVMEVGSYLLILVRPLSFERTYTPFIISFSFFFLLPEKDVVDENGFPKLVRTSFPNGRVRIGEVFRVGVPSPPHQSAGLKKAGDRGSG